MKINKEFLKEFTKSVDSAEVKECIELCLKEDFDNCLTAISLVQFSKSFDRFSKTSLEPYTRNPLNDEEFFLESLSEKVRSSGVYYFGPMFQIDESTSVRTAQDIRKMLRESGFDTDVIKPLSDELLDMYFTHLLETGLVSNSAR